MGFVSTILPTLAGCCHKELWINTLKIPGLPGSDRFVERARFHVYIVLIGAIELQQSTYRESRQVI